MTELPLQSRPLSKDQAVFVDVDNGTLDVSSEDSGFVQVTGQVPSLKDGEFSLTPSADGIHIVSKKVSRPFWQQNSSLLHLTLRVPSGATVNINDFDARIDVHDFSGKMNITSISGGIAVRDSTGVFVLNSNRGNVTVRATSGELRIAGNYGLLSMQDTRGRLTASTIMGTVQFAGQVGAGDNLALETDHGPVEIQLGQTSDAEVHIGTTSGVVTCMVPGLSYAGQGCSGTLGSGKGQISVRTVSGAVTLKPLP